MNRFEQLISEQMETMDQIITLQNELEHYQKLEEQYLLSEEREKVMFIRGEIDRLKKELEKIHSLFDQQTEELIRSYRPNTYI